MGNEGAIVNGNGHRLDPEIVVPANLTNISIADDGTVSGLDPVTKNTVQLGQITIVDFINPAGLSPSGESLFFSTEVSGDAIEGTPSQDQFGNIKQGFIESSNVKLVNEMVDLITAQRAYEANSKSISTTDQMLDTVNRLKR